MNVLLHSDKNFSEQITGLTTASSLFDPAIEQQARSIVEAVQARGDTAVLEFTERFNKARLSVEQIAVTQAELMAASLKADTHLRAAVAEASKTVEAFAKKSLQKNWSMRNSHGATV